MDLGSLSNSAEDFSHAKPRASSSVAAFVEFEHGIIKRTGEGGRAECESEGQRLGRANLIIDTVKVQKLRNEGCSIRQIAERLKRLQST